MALSFLKTGAEARKEMQQNDAEIELRKEERENAVRRFWIKRGGERKITFLDGDLDEEGSLLLTSYYEHNLYLNGNWRNFFVCTHSVDKSEPCPLCEDGNLPSAVSVFSVIDHTEYTDKDGNTHKDKLMLLVAKRQTRLLLEMQSVKRKGLAGCTFDVARLDEDQSPAVGTMFDYVAKNKVAAIKKKFGLDVIDYEKAINFKTPDELRAMGFGKSDKIGSEVVLDDDDDDGVPFDLDEDDADDGINLDEDLEAEI